MGGIHLAPIRIHSVAVRAFLLFGLALVGLSTAREQTNVLFTWPGDFLTEAHMWVKENGGFENPAFSPLVAKKAHEGDALVKAIYNPKFGVKRVGDEAVLTLTPLLGRKGKDVVTVNGKLMDAQDLVAIEIEKLIPDGNWRSKVLTYFHANTLATNYMKGRTVIQKGNRVLEIRTVNPEVLAPLKPFARAPDHLLGIEVEWKPELGMNLSNHFAALWQSVAGLGCRWVPGSGISPHLLVRVDGVSEQNTSGIPGVEKFKSARVHGSLQIVGEAGQALYTRAFSHPGVGLDLQSAIQKALDTAVKKEQGNLAKPLSDFFDGVDQARLKALLP